jgi:hypothetical protein
MKAFVENINVCNITFQYARIRYTTNAYILTTVYI